MKILVSVIAFVMFNTALSFAQNESSFGAFIASPVGDFGAKNIQNGSFAKSGGGIVFDSKYASGLLPKNLRIYLHSTYQWNDIDTDEIGKQYTAALGRRTTVTDSKVSPVLMTVGPSYSLPLSEKLSFELKGGIGLMLNNTKAFTVTVYDDDNNVLLSQLVNFDDKVAFAYTAGAELHFDIVKDKLGIALYSDYTGAKQGTEISGANITSVDSFQKLQYLNTGFKITWNK